MKRTALRQTALQGDAERATEPAEASVHELTSAVAGSAARRRRVGALPAFAGVLAASDAVALVVAFVIAEIAVRSDEKGSLSTAAELGLFLATLPAWIFVAQLYGLYTNDQRRADHVTVDEFVAIFHLTTIGTWLLGLVLWVSGSARPDPAKLVIFWVAASALVPSARAVARALARTGMRAAQNTIIVGAGRAGQLVARKILAHPEYGLNLLCFIDSAPPELDLELAGVPVMYRPVTLWEILRRFPVDRVILAQSGEPDEKRLDLAHELRAGGVHVDVVPHIFEMVGPQADLHSVEGLPLLGLPPLAQPQASPVKRALDVLAAATVLVLASLPLALVALLVKLDSPGPVLFRSERIGTDGRRFFVLKFRTMKQGAAEELSMLLADEARFSEFARTHKLKDDPRVTRVGRWLRRTSLDELPQLVNVLRGDLSLVGPRPITVAEFDGFVAHSESPGSWTGLSGYWDIPGLRPGLTGLWQVNGRSTIGFEERVRLDKLYFANWSHKLDLLILAKTVRVLVAGAGAGAA